MKKLITLVLLLSVLAASLFSLSGCYTVKSGKMKNVEGTYELTAYSKNEDMIAKNGIRLYVVIRSDGNG